MTKRQPDLYVVTTDPAPGNVPMLGRLSDRSKLSDRGLVDLRQVCKQMGIFEEETDTIRPAPMKAPPE